MHHLSIGHPAQLYAIPVGNFFAFRLRFMGPPPACFEQMVVSPYSVIFYGCGLAPSTRHRTFVLLRPLQFLKAVGATLSLFSKRIFATLFSLFADFFGGLSRFHFSLLSLNTSECSLSWLSLRTLLGEPAMRVSVFFAHREASPPPEVCLEMVGDPFALIDGPLLPTLLLVRFFCFETVPPQAQFQTRSSCLRDPLFSVLAAVDREC